MFVKLEKDGGYVGASNRALDGYFPVSAELHKSIRRTVVANASRIRNNRNWKPEPLVVSPEALWEDIQDYPQAVLETYGSLYADSLEIDITMIPYMGEESKMLEASVSKMRKYLGSKEMPSNLYEFVYEVSNLGDIPEAKFEAKKEEPKVEEVAPEPEATEEKKENDKPKKPRKKPTKSKGDGDEKSNKPSRDKAGEGSDSGSSSDPGAKGDGDSESKDS